MQSRWVGVMWAVSAAATLGVLIAAATGGITPPWWLVVLVAVPATITLVTSHSRSQAVGTMRPPVEARPPERSHRAKPAANPSQGAARTSAGDWETVSKIYTALDGRRVAWLRSSDFVTPWLDSNARRAIELERLVDDVVDSPLVPDISAALRILSGAIEAFVGFYAESTFPDPLLLGEEWRFFHRDEPEGADESIVDGKSIGDDESDTDGDWWAEQAAQLHLLATALADAYDGFTGVAARYPEVRSRIEVKV